MKRIAVLSLIISILFCCNVFATEETILSGIINEVYITDGTGDKIQCLILTLDEEKAFDIYDDMGDLVHVKTNEIQLSSNDYKSEMNGKRVTARGNNLFQGLTYYFIRPVMMSNARIEVEASVKTDVSVKVNGELIEFDQPPILKNGRTFVPIRNVAEKLGANVMWDDLSQCVTITSNSGNIQLYIGYAAPTINGVRTIIDATPFVENGRTLVPVRFVAQALGADVMWDNGSRSVIIDNQNKTDESIYNEYKANPELPIIFSSESSSDGICMIPQLNLKNSDLVNLFDERITKNLKQKMDYAYNISYSYSVNNDVLSVVASVMHEEEFYYTLNFDIKTGKEISYTDLCKKIHLSEEEYINNVHAKCVSSFDVMYPISKINSMGINEEFYNKQRSIAGSNKCFSTSSQWFIGSGKTINVIVCFPGLAGGDYLHAIDTGISIY